MTTDLHSSIEDITSSILTDLKNKYSEQYKEDSDIQEAIESAFSTDTLKNVDIDGIIDRARREYHQSDEYKKMEYDIEQLEILQEVLQ